MNFFKILSTGLIIVIFSLNTQFSCAQENEKICVGEKIKIKSSILGHDRDIFIYLPPRYNQSNATYPVIYATDAENTFLIISSLLEVLPQQGFLPNAIIVGIPNRGEKERYVDFAPEIQGQPESGRAELFIDFLEKELFQYVERNYRTQSFRIIQGHSFLGMFACHVFLTRPELFNCYVISSPDLRWIKENI
ncbi:MAG: alpha/beta hydrolase-fold protein [Bacteroidales bacterium]|nr:alpha/beta hydrolase-fold protein [Bacteroidales bacterium]